MHRGTNPARHPWFDRVAAGLTRIPDAVAHRQVTTNYGLTGGILDVVFWTHENGDPTGLTACRQRSER